MKRDLPILEGISQSPTNLRHIHTNKMYGTTVRVRPMCIFPVLFIELYQKWTANKEHVCNYYPSCSEYGRLAYIRYGFVSASLLTLERLRNCNSFSDWPQRNKP